MAWLWGPWGQTAASASPVAASSPLDMVNGVGLSPQLGTLLQPVLLVQLIGALVVGLAPGANAALLGQQQVGSQATTGQLSLVVSGSIGVQTSAALVLPWGC